MPEAPFGAMAEAGPESLLLRLEGFEGPLDLLLDLARAQKVDLAAISILALVEQYLAIVEGARRVRLELAADWLVMAAWLAWLKSRLLLPEEEALPGEAEQAAGALTGRLQELAAMRAAAAWLGARPVLGQDVHARGAPESFVEVDRSAYALDLAGLVRAYLAAVRRAGAKQRYRPRPVTFWTIREALERLARLVGTLPDWTSLERFLPEGLSDALARRAAIASTLVAGLEMARGGAVELCQERAFGPILVRPGAAHPGEGSGERAGA